MLNFTILFRGLPRLCCLLRYFPEFRKPKRNPPPDPGGGYWLFRVILRDGTGAVGFKQIHQIIHLTLQIPAFVGFCDFHAVFDLFDDVLVAFVILIFM